MATAPVLKALTELTSPRPGTPTLRGNIDTGLVFDFDPAILLPTPDATNVTALPSRRGKLSGASTLGAVPGTAYPTVRTNEAYPGLSFAGANALRTPAWTAPFEGAFTVAVVARATAITSAQNFYTGLTHPTRGLGYAAATPLGIGRGGSNQVLWNQPLNTGQYYLFIAVYDGANSVAQVNDLPATKGTTGGNASSFIPGFTFGANAAGSTSYLNGRILRAISWDRALTERERGVLAERMMAEYNL